LPARPSQLRTNTHGEILDSADRRLKIGGNPLIVRHQRLDAGGRDQVQDDRLRDPINNSGNGDSFPCRSRTRTSMFVLAVGGGA